MAWSKDFSISKEVTIEDVGKEVKLFLETEKKMHTMGGVTNSGSYLVQAKDIACLMEFLGANQALLVQIIPKGEDEITVRVGQGKWDEKFRAIAIGAIAILPFPSAVAAAVGAYNQYKLADEIFDLIKEMAK